MICVPVNSDSTSQPKPFSKTYAPSNLCMSSIESFQVLDLVCMPNCAGAMAKLHLTMKEADHMATRTWSNHTKKQKRQLLAEAEQEAAEEASIFDCNSPEGCSPHRRNVTARGDSSQLSVDDCPDNYNEVGVSRCALPDGLSLKHNERRRKEEEACQMKLEEPVLDVHSQTVKTPFAEYLDDRRCLQPALQRAGSNPDKVQAYKNTTAEFEPLSMLPTSQNGMPVCKTRSMKSLAHNTHNEPEPTVSRARPQSANPSRKFPAGASNTGDGHPESGTRPQSARPRVTSVAGHNPSFRPSSAGSMWTSNAEQRLEVVDELMGGRTAQRVQSARSSTCSTIFQRPRPSTAQASYQSAENRLRSGTYRTSPATGRPMSASEVKRQLMGEGPRANMAAARGDFGEHAQSPAQAWYDDDIYSEDRECPAVQGTAKTINLLPTHMSQISFKGDEELDVELETLDEEEAMETLTPPRPSHEDRGIMNRNVWKALEPPATIPVHAPAAPPPTSFSPRGGTPLHKSTSSTSETASRRPSSASASRMTPTGVIGRRPGSASTSQRLGTKVGANRPTSAVPRQRSWSASVAGEKRPSLVVPARGKQSSGSRRVPAAADASVQQQVRFGSPARSPSRKSHLVHNNEELRHSSQERMGTFRPTTSAIMQAALVKGLKL